MAIARVGPGGAARVTTFAANSDATPWVIVEGATSTIVSFAIGAGLVGTVTFQGCHDTAAPFVILAVPIDNTVGATTTTTSGIYRVDAAALYAVRAIVTAYTSGSASVTVGEHHG